MYYVIRPEVPTNFSRIKAFVPAGNLYENKNNSGISHLLEHVLAEKDEKLWVDKGVQFNAFTSNNNVIYDIAGDSKYFIEMLSFIEKMLSTKLDQDQRLEISKKSVLEELLNHKGNPYHVLVDALYKNAYPNDGKYSYDIHRKIQCLNKLTPLDLENFRKKHYNNIVFVIYTNSPYDLFKNSFGTKYKKSLKKSQKSSGVIYKEIKMPASTKTNFIVGYKCKPINYEQKCIYQYIILDMLCGSLSAVLYKKLRSELNLVYNISLRFEYANNTGILLSIFEFSTSKDPDLLLKTFLAEIDNFKSGLFSGLETSIKKITIFDNDNCKNSSFLCDFYGHQLAAFGRCISYKEHMKLIKSTTKEKLVPILKEFFNEIIIIKSV